MFVTFKEIMIYVLLMPVIIAGAALVALLGVLGEFVTGKFPTPSRVPMPLEAKLAIGLLLVCCVLLQFVPWFYDRHFAARRDLLCFLGYRGQVCRVITWAAYFVPAALLGSALLCAR